MPARTAPDLDATIVGAEPMIFVTDMAASCAFYADKLGFRVVFSCGEPPYYAQVARGGARLNLRHVDGPVFAPDFRSRTVDALAAMITVADAEPFFVEFQAADAPFHQVLRPEPWGARTFIVRDPDGNLIAFAGAGP